jgi:hypothetical protein
MHWKEFAFMAVVTAVAILLIEPAIEKGLVALSPATAAKLGVTA